MYDKQFIDKHLKPRQQSGSLLVDVVIGLMCFGLVALAFVFCGVVG